jgi:hypothetical protein
MTAQHFDNVVPLPIRSISLALNVTDPDSVEVCTLDRCQGREASCVILSLVRSRATSFMDAPKRWNVGLTRAKDRLFIVGDSCAFLQQAIQARAASAQPRMSLLARVIEAYAKFSPLKVES